MSQAAIIDWNDLTDEENGSFSLNFRSGEDNGSVRISSEDLANKWYCSYAFKLDANWSWGASTYEGNDKFLSNVKCFRLWNPGDTPENVVITMQGWDGGNFVFEIEGIEGQHKYFFSDFKERITKGVWHKFEFEFKENSALGASDGHMKMWFDNDLILDRGHLITRQNNSGLKRPYIIGFDNMWGSDNDKAPNDYSITNIHAGKDEVRGEGVPIDPVPPIEPPVDETMPEWFKTFIRGLAAALDELVS